VAEHTFSLKQIALLFAASSQHRTRILKVDLKVDFSYGFSAPAPGREIHKSRALDRSF